MSLRMRTRWPWRAFVSLCVFTVVDLVTAFVVGCVATLTNSSRLGWLEVPLLVAAFVAAVTATVWVDETGVPVAPRKMSRADRRRFESEESRLELESRIRETELKLGLREASGEVAVLEPLPSLRDGKR